LFNDLVVVVTAGKHAEVRWFMESWWMWLRDNSMPIPMGSYKRLSLKTPVSPPSDTADVQAGFFLVSKDLTLQILDPFEVKADVKSPGEYRATVRSFRREFEAAQRSLRTLEPNQLKRQPKRTKRPKRLSEDAKGLTAAVALAMDSGKRYSRRLMRQDHTVALINDQTVGLTQQAASETQPAALVSNRPTHRCSGVSFSDSDYSFGSVMNPSPQVQGDYPGGAPATGAPFSVPPVIPLVGEYKAKSSDDLFQDQYIFSEDQKTSDAGLMGVVAM